MNIDIVIAGSRSINAYVWLCAAMKRFQTAHPDFKISTVITGGAKGVDTLGHRWALDNRKSTNIVKALWDLHGKSAGMIRNGEMARLLVPHGALVCLWDGQSRGAHNMIEQALKLDILTWVETPDGVIYDTSVRKVKV